ncbi:MAG: T9SS type A sorting domain-containing protein [Burkholderiales bacterium]|nr:T9SS type A sorting domain-containing protein [Bacteroidia bacterium]
MKKIIIIILISLKFINMYGQIFNWAKKGGSWAYDYGYGIGNDPAGNLYVAGKYEMNAIFNNVTLPCQGNHDIFLAKYNTSGSLTWIKTAGGMSGDYAHALAIDNSFVYIAGEIEGSGNPVKFIGSNITLYPKGDNDIFVAKYDFNGNILWAKSAGDYNGEKALGVTTDQNGNVFICGYFKNKTVIGNTTLYGNGGSEIFIAKLDPNGNWLWAKKAGGIGRDEAKAIKCDAAGNVYVCGMHANGAKFDNQTLYTSDGYVNGFFSKYSTNGSLIWAKSLGGSYDDVAWSITSDIYGKMFISGQFNSSINFGSTNLYTSGSADIFVAAYDINGNAVWAKKAGGYGNDIARGIGTDGKNIFITGQYGGTATFGSVSKTAADNSDIFISCLNNNGQFLWTSTAGGSADAFEDLGYESGNVICAEPNGNVYASGAMLNGGVFGGTYLSGYSRTDIFITKLTNNFLSKEDGSESIVLEGQVSESNVVLNWTAPEKKDSLFYVIEKSVDSTHFESIAQVEPNVRNEYSFTDALSKTSEGNTYYRLAKTTNEGGKLYSNIIAVLINKDNCLQCMVFPNPTKNSFTISLKPFGKQATNNSFTTYLYDYLGAEQKQVNVNYGESVIDVSSLTAGIYLMVIREGAKVVYEDKIVIQ